MTRQLTDIAYNGTQRLDLYLVDSTDQPLVVCLHGGGFFTGDKGDKRCRQAAMLLVDAGFNCASISYSLAPRESRFAMWPRNLFDVADALACLHEETTTHGYDFSRLGMLGFSAGCCLANLYIHGGEMLYRHFGYETLVFRPAAMAGFYGPYDFSSRQPERQSGNDEINRKHSPSYWLRQTNAPTAPPVLHIQGDLDDVVFPSQHEAFQRDYEERGYNFKAVIVAGFGHSFAPRDTNANGETIDLSTEISSFFSQHLPDQVS